MAMGCALFEVGNLCPDSISTEENSYRAFRVGRVAMRHLKRLNLELNVELESGGHFVLLPARVWKLFATIFASNEMPQLRWI